MKFIHLADSHLSDKFENDGGLGSLVRKKSWETFEKIFADNKDVDFALLAGDLFERNYFSSKDFERLFRAFSNFEKPIYYVTGNHDYFDDYNRIFLNQKPNNLYIFTKDKLSMFELDRVRIYGLSYKDRIFNGDFPYDIALDRSYFNILLAHGDIYPDVTNYLDLNPRGLMSTGFDYVALGHIHKAGNDGVCYYPGSIEPFSFADLGDHGYIRYEDGNAKFIKDSQMKFYKFNLQDGDFDDETSLADYVNDRLKDKINFIRIDLNGHKDFNISLIKREINASHVEIIKSTDINLDEIMRKYPNSLLSKFNDKFLYTDLDDVSKLARELGIDAILRSRR